MNSRLKFAVVFICGFLLGGAAVGYYIHHCFKRTWVNCGNYDHFLGFLGNKLDLTAEQKDKIAAIFKDETPKLDSIHKATQGQVRALMEDVTARIRLVLNPEQQKKLDEMKARWAKHDVNGWKLPNFGSYPSQGNSPSVPATPPSKN